MTRLLLGVTLERICKAVLLLCLLHFVIIMILYFDVYAQHLDFFSRFNARNASRAHPFSNSSRPNSTAPSYGPAGAEPPSPSAKPSTNRSVTEKPLQPCQETPPGLGEVCGARAGRPGAGGGVSPSLGAPRGFPVVPGWGNPSLVAGSWSLLVWGEVLGVPCPRQCRSPLRVPLAVCSEQRGDRDLSCVPCRATALPSCSRTPAHRVQLPHEHGAGAAGEPRRAPGRQVHPPGLLAPAEGGHPHPLPAPRAPPQVLAALPAPHPAPAEGGLRHLHHQPGL